MIKFILPFLAWIFGLGFFSIFFAWLFGSGLDRFFAFGLSGINPLSKLKRQAVFMETVFLLKGNLAKADGRICENEINHVEAFMTQLGMTAEHRKQSISLFKEGSAEDFTMESTLDKFLATCGHTHHLKQLLLVCLISMALADGVLDKEEDALLKAIADKLGFSEADYKNLIEMIKNQEKFSGNNSASKAQDLDSAYHALNIKPNSTDQEIKRAYRKLISQYHPDKLMGQGVPEDMIKVATEKAQEIQAAYDLIKDSKSN